MLKLLENGISKLNVNFKKTQKVVPTKLRITKIEV